jgi:hypothetical protein
MNRLLQISVGVREAGIRTGRRLTEQQSRFRHIDESTCQQLARFFLVRAARDHTGKIEDLGMDASSRYLYIAL